MTYPERAIVRPSCLNGTTNGKLPSRILTSTEGQAGGIDVVLVTPAARAWRALAAAALDAGHTLKLSGFGCGYRDYTTQERIFRERYTTTYLAGRPSRMWNGQRWYQRPGTAVAAVPGTSNHGWGLAVDCGEERDSDLAAEPLDSKTLQWLIDHEQTFGFSHELQSEPWHLHYFRGDSIPVAVLAYEQHGDIDMTPDALRKIVREEVRAVHTDDWAVHQLEGNEQAILDAKRPARARPSIRQLLLEIRTGVDALVARK